MHFLTSLIPLAYCDFYFSSYFCTCGASVSAPASTHVLTAFNRRTHPIHPQIHTRTVPCVPPEMSLPFETVNDHTLSPSVSNHLCRAQSSLRSRPVRHTEILFPSPAETIRPSKQHNEYTTPFLWASSASWLSVVSITCSQIHGASPCASPGSCPPAPTLALDDCEDEEDDEDDIRVLVLELDVSCRHTRMVRSNEPEMRRKSEVIRMDQTSSVWPRRICSHVQLLVFQMRMMESSPPLEGWVGW